MYDQTLHRGRKHFCRYLFLKTAEKLKCHIKIALKLMVNKLLRCLKRVNVLNSKTLEEQ